MIELVSATRCIQCNICISVCPTNVFNRVDGAPPTIARQGDCQTCFMCELYCPTDALYVDSNANESVLVDEKSLIASGVLGSYRKNIGWAKERTPVAQASRSL